MRLTREITTPLTAGAFLLLAVTGVLMFFHLEIGLNKLAHQWMSWALLAGVALHVSSNFMSFKRHMMDRRGQIFIGVFLLLLALSCFKWGTKEMPPNWASSVQVLAQIPLAELADVAHMDSQDLLSKLRQSGIDIVRTDQSIAEVVGDNLRKQAKALQVGLSRD